jgi:hypothetical protein
MVKDCHGVEAQQAKEKQTSKCKHHYETLMRTTRIDASLAFLFASFPLQLLLPLHFGKLCQQVTPQQLNATLRTVYYCFSVSYPTQNRF